MRCKYGNVWLTGLPWYEDCGEVIWDAAQAVDVKPLVRSSEPYIRGMGNRTESLPVPVILQAPSELDALRYIADLPWTLPDNGSLVFIEQFGTVKLTITYTKAAFQKVTRRRVGVSVEAVYSFIITGRPTFETDGAAPLRITTEDGNYLTTES